MEPAPLQRSDIDALVALPLDELMAKAASVRDGAHGTRITYSPKVFIPLTMLCRDKCGYCTFAQPPARLEAPYLEPDEVRAIASRGAAVGCHEALFTLGEQPEDRYQVARDWLKERGFASTVAYLAAMAELVTAETGLLPHANAGALPKDELALLRRVSPSQGMMIESLNPDLAAHRGAPDKHPTRRLDTLSWAGELGIPFTTGILVGIGESLDDRIAALLAIADAHARFGHVQEVIVQNFLPKLGTGMANAPACPPNTFLQAIALARLILPADIHLQAPPNLSDSFEVLLDAGIDDWGGVSPVTADHVNPERPWPAVELLRERTEAAGFELAPRLTIYPEFAQQPERWLEEHLRFAVLDRQDAEGLARDDPGACFSERAEAAPTVSDGVEIDLTQRRSTAWYAGNPTPPPTIIPGPTRARGRIAAVLDDVRNGAELQADDIVTLCSARGREVAAVTELADEFRQATVGDVVTFVTNRNINYTNVCTFKCTFCGFSKGPLSLNLRGTPYLLDLATVQARAVEAAEAGATEVCLQGGIHPSFDGDYYVDVCRAVHEAAPSLHIHGFTALEVHEGARRSGQSVEAYLEGLMAVGLRSLPGTAAEILDDEVRAVICRDKVTTAEWLDVHRTAHGLGLRSNATIMFGTIESPISWARHLLAVRALQRETGGFTEFVPLPFVHMGAPMYLQGAARRGPTWRETVLMHAVARITLHPDITNIQASWVKLGPHGAQQLLRAGVNDLGGTLMDENISRAAGANHGRMLTASEFRAIAKPLGREVQERTTLYEPVRSRIPSTT